MIDHNVRLSPHTQSYAIFGSLAQVQTCDIRDCDGRRKARNGIMVGIKAKQAEAVEVFERLERLDVTQRDLAEALNLAENKISKIRSGERQITAGEYRAAVQWLDDVERRRLYQGTSDHIDGDPLRAYLPIDILPSFGGMGGGGSGEGDHEQALIARRLVEDELRAKPSDLLLIEARGESMAPDFLHGDQILVDRRDCNPVQPGAFALWDGDGYVVKLVERVPRARGLYRIFSANDRFSAYEVSEEEVTIMGRPVWFGRRI